MTVHAYDSILFDYVPLGASKYAADGTICDLSSWSSGYKPNFLDLLFIQLIIKLHNYLIFIFFLANKYSLLLLLHVYCHILYVMETLKN